MARLVAISLFLALLLCEVLTPVWWQQVRLIGAIGLLGVGVLHGSFDELLAQKVIPRSRAKFYLSYLAAASGMLLSFCLSPQLTLLVFVLLSAYHFGEEELLKVKSPPLVALIRGASYFTPAVLLHSREVAPILQEMGVILPTVLYEKGLPLCLTLFAFDLLYASSRSSWGWKQDVETWSFWVLAIVAHPLVSFALYFTLKHSREHVRALFSHWLSDYSGGKILRKAFPIVVATTSGCALFFCWSSSLSSTVLAHTFVALAALSLPHAYLVHLATSRESTAPQAKRLSLGKVGSRRAQVSL